MLGLNSRNARASLVVSAALTAAVVLSTVGISSADQHGGPFSNASLHGTYTYVHISSGADDPVPADNNIGLLYYDGTGTYRFANMIATSVGEPDEEGNPTRVIRATLKDPTTWFHFSATYEVLPFGGIIFHRPFGGDETGNLDTDGLVTRVEMIDGVLTIVDSIACSTVLPNGNTGGLQCFTITRVADGDIVPPAPPPAE